MYNNGQGVDNMEPDYKNVLVAHGWIGQIDIMRENAKSVNYPMFMWNGRIYSTETGDEVVTMGKGS